MAGSSEFKFLQQQGYTEATEDTSKRHYNALLFQPTIVGSFMALAILFQSSTLFFIFGVILWFNTLLPQFNIFEMIYNSTLRLMRNEPRLGSAPMPRRFMQGMAGTLMLLASFTLSTGLATVSYVIQAFIAVAFSALLFGKFCLGAYIYHLINGNAKFANATCPWSK